MRAHLLVRGEAPAVPTGYHLLSKLLGTVTYISRCSPHDGQGFGRPMPPSQRAIRSPRSQTNIHSWWWWWNKRSCDPRFVEYDAPGCSSAGCSLELLLGAALVAAALAWYWVQAAAGCSACRAGEAELTGVGSRSVPMARLDAGHVSLWAIPWQSRTFCCGCCCCCCCCRRCSCCRRRRCCCC
jgi:hypothetical protein